MVVIMNQPTTIHDKPLAVNGLVSYRYQGRFGWIMVGAKDDADALRQAQRSTRDPVVIERLQVWEVDKYVFLSERVST
jgi:hypothetical protein